MQLNNGEWDRQTSRKKIYKKNYEDRQLESGDN